MIKYNIYTVKLVVLEIKRRKKCLVVVRVEMARSQNTSRIRKKWKSIWVYVPGSRYMICCTGKKEGEDPSVL